MARGNGRSINVKIPTIKVINALETKLEKVKKDYANQNVNEAKHEKAVEKWSKDVATLAMAHTGLVKEVTANVRWTGEINVEFSGSPSTGGLRMAHGAGWVSGGVPSCRCQFGRCGAGFGHVVALGKGAD